MSADIQTNLRAAFFASTHAGSPFSVQVPALLIFQLSLFLIQSISFENRLMQSVIGIDSQYKRTIFLALSFLIIKKGDAFIKYSKKD
jgi:hypothetical protein